MTRAALRWKTTGCGFVSICRFRELQWLSVPPSRPDRGLPAGSAFAWGPDALYASWELRSQNFSQALGGIASCRRGSLSTLTGVQASCTPSARGRRSARDGLGQDFPRSTVGFFANLLALGNAGLEQIRRPSRLLPSLLDIPPTRNDPTRVRCRSACNRQKVPRAR
jgi:hypothetical protein